MEYTDIVGNRSGKLVVQNMVGKDQVGKQRRNRYLYQCKCDCGNTAIVDRVNLTGGHSKSCGCLKKRLGTENPKWRGHNDISGGYFSNIKAAAKERGLSFDITIEDAWNLFIKQNKLCAITKWPLEMRSTTGFNRTASLDRIDNTLGYTKNNVQWLHTDINWMKGTFSMDYFLKMCKAVSGEYQTCLLF